MLLIVYTAIKCIIMNNNKQKNNIFNSWFCEHAYMITSSLSSHNRPSVIIWSNSQINIKSTTANLFPTFYAQQLDKLMSFTVHHTTYLWSMVPLFRFAHWLSGRSYVRIYGRPNNIATQPNRLCASCEISDNYVQYKHANTHHIPT